MKLQQSWTRALAVALATLLLSSLALTSTASGATDDLNTKRDEVRRERAEKASQIDVLKAKKSDINNALNALDDNVSGQESLADRAARAELEASQAAAEARDAEDAKVDQISQLEAAAQKVALNLYMDRGDDGFGTFLPGQDMAGAIYRSQLSELAVGGAQSSIDELDAAREDLASARSKAEHAQQKAAKRRQVAELASQQLHAAISLSQRLQGEVEDRIDENLQEAASLASLDGKLSKQIQAQEAEIAARLRKSEEEALARAAANPRVAALSGALTFTSTRSGGRPMIIPAGGNLVSVDGIKVDASIAAALGRMIAAAAADGFVLRGNGYRSASAQIAVRRNNCGSSQYDIWQKPASVCHPPAARPGTSMHEKGLAIDFTCNGSLITSYGSACYAWMRAHAPSFGFLNRPGEAWHWSVNGH
jgi:LAS superfamily LD-carboxypeptidase LdcB